MKTDQSNWTTKQWIAALQPKKRNKMKTALGKALMPTTELSILDVTVVDLADRLRLPNSPEGQHIWGRLSADLRDQITADQEELDGDLSDSSAEGLIKELNGIIHAEPLWDDAAFLNTDRRISTRKFCEEGETTRANRALIEDAFPGCVARAGAYAIPREFQQAEKTALEVLNQEVEFKWKVLLMDPEFQKVLEEGKPGVVVDYCRATQGLQPPGNFGIRVWCEMRSRMGQDKNPLLKLLSTSEFLWRGRPRIDLKESQVKARRRSKSNDGDKRPPAQKEDELVFLRHFVRRELRQGQIAALFLSYFETIQVTRSSLMNEFGFSKNALKALSVIGRLIAEDADVLLKGEPKVRLIKGKGRNRDEGYNKMAVEYFRVAWDNPAFSPRQVVEGLGHQFDSTHRKCASRMVDLAASTRAHLGRS